MNLKPKILNSLLKFDLDIKGKCVLTEAATGNFVVTPILAALGGAEVFALTKDSEYGSVDEVSSQTYSLAEQFGIKEKIKIITSYEEVDLNCIDVLTNTGFNRPINRWVIKKLPPGCVIPLMWEPWEFRSLDLDMEACCQKGIKVYGTNESDENLQTMNYIGLTVLYFLLQKKKTPYSSRILILGNEKFVQPVMDALSKHSYRLTWVKDYTEKINDLSGFDTIICLEHEKPDLLIGQNGVIESKSIGTDTLILHIAGNVRLEGLACRKIPETPAPFGYMSFTADFIDPMAVIDLHTAGLKVAEGMLKANSLNLAPSDYRSFMERNYPALAFSNPKYW